MSVFSGNTSSNLVSQTWDIPAYITFCSLVNTSGGNITVDVAIVYGSTFVYILKNHSITSADPQYNLADKIKILAGRKLYVASSGSCDYYFVIE